MSLLPVLFLLFLLTGCADMVEIQERDFVMALGISYDDNYKITFALPNLDAITGQSTDGESDNFIRTFHGTSFPEIEETYNQNSKNRLDLRHLEAIVFDDSILKKPDKMKKILSFMNDNYELSHNVLVFYYPDDVKKLMKMEGALGGSIGDYLLKLNKNTQKRGIQNVTIGHLITAEESNNIIAIPALNHDDKTIYLDGSALFQNDQVLQKLNQEESELLHIMRGEGNDYLFHLPDQTVVRLNRVKSKLKYQLIQNQTFIQLTIKGTGEAIPDSHSAYPLLANKLNASIKELIETHMMPIILNKKVDFLNLYEKSSYKQPDIWLRYEKNPEAFLKNLTLDVSVNFTLE